MQRLTSNSYLLIFSLLLFPLASIAQTTLIKGRIIDFETRDALAFVNIQINDGPEGCISDIDGRFTIQSQKIINKLKISYIGYKPIEVKPEKNGIDLLVRMHKTTFELPETEIKPGINPAHRIIRQVIANRFINDHEHLPSFTYTSYEKTIFGPDSDSIPPIDSLTDVANYLKVKEFFRKQHLFIMESVVNRSFRFPSDNYNKVIASRVSGLSDPLFVFLMAQLQSTTFYSELIKIVDKEYVNPISNGSFKKYYFELQDTIIEPYPNDTTYIISFRPLLKTNFNGLKGSISISTNGFAIRNIIAKPSDDEGSMTVKIQQSYEFVDNTHWFPVQLNTDLVIETKQITIDSTHKRSMKILGRSKSYISDINLNPKLLRNQFGIYEVDVQPDAYSQPEKIWNKFRIDSLTTREQTTYRVIDSLGKARHFDRRTAKLNSLISGSLTIGYIDLYLDQLFSINYQEGIRVGLKLSTSDRVSSWFKIGGFAAYGLKDQKYKYGFDGSVVFNRFSDFKVKASYYNNVNEAGADDMFNRGSTLLVPEMFRETMIGQMDQTRCYNADISSRILKYLTLKLGVSAYNRIPLYSYKFLVQSSENISVTTSDFSFTEASISIRYAYGEKFIKNAHSTLSLGTKCPVIQLYASHGFNDVLGGQYTFNRFDLKITKSVFTKYFGTTSVSFQAGLINGNIPFVNLYNARAAYIGFDLYSPNSFSTMRMDEFASDRYASVFISHNFGVLLFQSKYFNPEPELITNLGIGSLSHPENHLGINLKSFEKGYFESGLALNKMLRMGLTDLGIAWFYQYGPYARPSAKENMAWKIVIQFAL